MSAALPPPQPLLGCTEFPTDGTMAPSVGPLSCVSLTCSAKEGLLAEVSDLGGKGEAPGKVIGEHEAGAIKPHPQLSALTHAGNGRRSTENQNNGVMTRVSPRAEFSWSRDREKWEETLLPKRCPFLRLCAYISKTPPTNNPNSSAQLLERIEKSQPNTARWGN